MECGIIGLAGSGKTTLFNALTGGHATGFAQGAGAKPNVGIAKIPDDRLGVISGFLESKKITHATVRLVDIPGVPPDSGATKLNAFLAHTREVDAMCHVVRCFDDGRGLPKPEQDIERMETNLVIADLEIAESAFDRATRAARGQDKDAKARADVLQKCLELLNDGKSIRSSSQWTESERNIMRGYGMVTAKPALYVANISEDDLEGDSSFVSTVCQHVEASGGEAIAVCAKLEAELAELDESDRNEMLQSLGLKEPAIGVVAHAMNSLLGLTTFYTAGEKETRAWPVHVGATAPEAAGCVHTDMQRGFIRAECYHIDDLVEFKSEKAIREAGKMRSEGKNYHIQDGDVVQFLFNV